MSQSSTEEVTTTSSTLSFNKGNISHAINVDKFSREAKEFFIIEVPTTGERHRIKKESMLEIAKESQKADAFNYLLGDGYEGSKDIAASAGKALKIVKADDCYHVIVFTGEVGKSFDPKKVLSKTYIDLNRVYLDAIFTFLIEDDKVKEAKKADKKLQRTTLELN